MNKNKRFQYLDREKSRVLRKDIVGWLVYTPALYKNTVLMTVNDINEVSRSDLAEMFLKQSIRAEWLKQLCDEGKLDHKEVLDDIACYIDLKLPACLYKKMMFRKCKLEGILFEPYYKNHAYMGIHCLPGALFKWSENYLNDRAIIITQLNQKAANEETEARL